MLMIMNKAKKYNLALSVGCIMFFLISTAIASPYQVDTVSPSKPTYLHSQTLVLEFNFSYPKIIVENDYIWVYVNETNLNMIVPDQPVLPTNITELMFEFGTKILGIEYTCSSPEIINL